MPRGKQEVGGLAPSYQAALDAIERKKKKRLERFYQIAENYDLAPDILARRIAAGITPQEQYDHYYNQFAKKVQDYYGTQIGQQNLSDPQGLKMLYQAWSTKKKFDYWQHDWPTQLGPETILSAVTLPDLASNATSEVFKEVFSIYGGQYSAAVLQVALIQDPEQRDATWKILEDIAGQPMPKTNEYTPPSQLGAPSVPAPAGQLGQPDLASLQNSGIDPNELISQLVNDPGSFDKMTKAEQQVAITAARGALEVQPQVEQDLSATGIAQQAMTAREVFMRQNGYSLVLNKDEQKRLRGLIDSLPRTGEAADAHFANTDFFTTNVDIKQQAGDLGLVAFREPGVGQPGAVPIFTFDPEWVKKNFAKHAGIVDMLVSLYPNAKFEYGTPGAMGQFFDLLNRGTDKISAFVGAGFEQFKEVHEALNQPDRAHWQQRYETLRAQLESGQVPEKDWNETVSAMLEAKDKATGEYGLQPMIDTYMQRSNPTEFGTGFGDSMTHYLGIYPGDHEYDLVHGVSTLVGQIIFDPTIIAGKVTKAVRLAQLVPEGATISKSLLTQTLFDSLAQSPEMLLAGSRGRKISERIYEVGKTYDTADEFATRMHDVLQVDMPTARHLAYMAKEGPESLQAGMLSAFVGGEAKNILEPRVLGAINEADAALQAIDKFLPNEIRNIKARLARRVAKASDTEIATGTRQLALAPTDEVMVERLTTQGVRPRTAKFLASLGVSEEDALRLSNRAVMNMGGAEGSRLARFEKLTDAHKLERIQAEVESVLGMETRIGRGLEKLPNDRNFGGDGVFHADVPTKMLRDEGLLDNTIVSKRVRPNARDVQAEQATRGGLTDAAEQAAQDEFAAKMFAAAGETPPAVSAHGGVQPAIRSDTQLEELKRLLAEWQAGRGEFPGGPIMAEVRPNGVIAINDGTHRVMLAHELGIENLPVQFSTNGLEAADRTWKFLDRYLPTALYRQPVQLTKEIDDLTTMLRNSTDKLVELRGTRDRVLAEKLYWQNVLKGADYSPLVPLRQLPTLTSLHGLGPATTRFGRVWEAATQYVRALPMGVMESLGAGDMARFLAHNPVVDETATRFMQALRRFGEHTGTGKRLWFETSVLPEGVLADEAVNQSYRHLRDFARFIGVPDSSIDEVITDISTAAAKHSHTEVYDSFVNGYQRFLDEAVRLDELGRQSLRDMWPELLGERAPAFVREGRGKYVKSTPTVWMPKFDDAGKMFPSGVPSIEADMLRGFTLPTYEQVRDHVGMVRSFMRGMQEGGSLPAKAVTGAYFNMTGAWRSFNAAWAKAVLLFRMPTALPLRIQMEQQFRIEAYGYAGVVAHPVEWFRSLKGADEFKLFAESPGYALGTITKDMLGDSANQMLRRGRQTVNIVEDAEPATKALAGRIKAYASSPSTRIFLSDAKDAEVVAKLQASPFFWNKFRPLWDEVIAAHVEAGGPLTTYEKIANRIRTEMKQVIGSGDIADEVKAAALTGRMRIAGEKTVIVDKRLIDPKTGKMLTEDANQIADELLRAYKAGEWKPGIFEFPRKWGDYLPPSRNSVVEQLHKASDWMFNTFYSRADLYFGRSPLFRQIAAREYDRLRSLGWGEKSAAEAAKVFGARQTADILFTIGADSSADFFLRSAMPFFPAWKELARTWLAKIPAEIGGGGVTGWMFGAPSLVSRLDHYLEFLRAQDFIVNEGGNWKIKVPFLGDLIRKTTGLDMDIKASAESFTSLLPAPSLNEDDPFWKGMLPTLGAPSGLALHAINSRFGGAFDDIENNLTLFGGNQSLGPAAVDNAFEAFGFTPPWAMGQTGEMADMRREWAFVDALRIKYAELAPTQPVRKDFKSEKDFVRAQASWLENLYHEADQGARRWYFARSISSLFLPFSIQYSTPALRETTAIWDVINGIQDSVDTSGMATPLLEGLRQAHPELKLYLTGKTVSLVGDNPDRVDTYDAFTQEIAHGQRLSLSPKQWLVWALGNQEAALHRSRLNEIFDRYGSTPQQWLLSGYENARALRAEQNRWDAYLHQTDLLANQMDLRTKDGEPTSFRQMYTSFYEAKTKRNAKEKVASLTLQQEQAGQALDALDSLANFFGATQYTDADYLAVRRRLNEIADPKYGTSSDPVFQATSWWWNQVRPYFDEKNAVWQKIYETPTAQRAPLYRELTAIENQWATKALNHPKWGAMPTPQEVMFQKLSPDAKQLKLYDWATLPIDFLSRYQRDKVYGVSKKDPEIDRLVAKVTENERLFDTVVASRALSYSSKEYETLRKYTDQKNMQDAKQLGLASEFAKWDLPAYKRVDALVKNDPIWTTVVQFADAGRRFLEQNETSPRGQTAAAVEYQRRIVSMVEEGRKSSPRFDHLMKILEIAYGEGPDQPAVGIDTYWPLFFSGFGSAPAYLLYGG